MSYSEQRRQQIHIEKMTDSELSAYFRDHANSQHWLEPGKSFRDMALEEMKRRHIQAYKRFGIV
jgi:hypothetical protein